MDSSNIDSFLYKQTLYKEQQKMFFSEKKPFSLSQKRNDIDSMEDDLLLMEDDEEEIPKSRVISAQPSARKTNHELYLSE